MRGAVFLLGIFSWAEAAQAAPWGQSKHEIYARTAIAFEEIEGLSAYRYDVYSEYGLGGGWTATAKAEWVDFEDGDLFDAEGFRATLRRELHRRDHWVLALEGGVLRGAAFGGAPDGCDETGGEVRIGAGYSGGFETGRNWFTFAEFVAREYDSGCSRQRLELGYGDRIFGDLYAITHYWLERGSDNARSDKVEFSLNWRADVADISLGYREEFSGAFEESSLVLAIAKRF